ncbi:hypothetical protein EBZ39_05475 [bacterium]|nr:hypothetical protein [bacterium]
MAQINRSAKLYQERRQPVFQPTWRSPGLQANLADNAVHDLKLNPPYPAPNYCENGDPPTDSGLTQVWPYGDSYAK